ncbi:hypothetical protein RND71_022883 [Anisodus tanguticus]|uniref:K+ potassium transporter integral membrane domain-containing protein n=1 Tax=Anisodus tanguticus TaxID=243964 RepID=A0AAE1RUM2_9SOLA|nr:hypothetical protein RND71_022883 [Anisodus tanguticus]
MEILERHHFLSAVGGLKAAALSVLTEGRLVWIAVAILIILIYDATIIRALNPMYIIDYFKRNQKNAWISLGGVVMCITGGEALFADVGHFSVRSIQISMCCVTYPALILAYLGQAAFLRKHSYDVSDTFYKSLPHSLYWPVFAVAVLAAIIASQALISGTFAIIRQSLALGCFPRVKIVHTSIKHHGQIYIPEINNLLMLACVIVTLAFRTTEKLSHAYGIAVVIVITLTSCFLVLVMIMKWKTHILFVIVYVLIIGTVELVGCYMERDIEVVERAYSVGVVHLVREQDVIASQGSSIAKRVVIDYAFNFLKRSLRQSSEVFDIPHKLMLNAGMIYEL